MGAPVTVMPPWGPVLQNLWAKNKAGDEVWGPESARWSPLGARGLLGPRCTGFKAGIKLGGPQRTDHRQWGLGPAGSGSLGGCEQQTAQQISCAQVKRPEAGSPGTWGRRHGHERAEEGATTLGHRRRITCRGCEASIFLNLIFSSSWKGAWCCLGLSHILGRCICLAGRQPPLPQLSGRKGVVYVLISLSVCLPHRNVSSMNQGLSSAQGLGECLVHSKGSIKVYRMNEKVQE